MSKFIRVGNSEEYIPVIDVYAYIYDHGDGKTVLRIKMDASVKTFDQLMALFGSGVDQTITSYESSMQDTDDNEPKMIALDRYDHFCLDYKCNFSSTEYFIEITRKPDIAIMADDNATAVLDAYSALADLYESTLE